MEKFSNIFKVLADNNRLKILSIIHKENEVCACKLLELLNITQPTLVYHMKMMQDIGLLDCYKQGRWCVYSIKYEKLEELKKFITDFRWE